MMGVWVKDFRCQTREPLLGESSGCGHRQFLAPKFPWCALLCALSLNVLSVHGGWLQSSLHLSNWRSISVVTTMCFGRVQGLEDVYGCRAKGSCHPLVVQTKKQAGSKAVIFYNGSLCPNRWQKLSPIISLLGGDHMCVL